MIPPWVNILAGAACLLLALNFFWSAVKPNIWLVTDDSGIRVVGRDSKGSLFTIISASKNDTSANVQMNPAPMPDALREMLKNSRDNMPDLNP